MANRENLIVPIFTFSIWVAGFAWMLLHFGG
jgi:hypothetical protein